MSDYPQNSSSSSIWTDNIYNGIQFHKLDMYSTCPFTLSVDSSSSSLHHYYYIGAGDNMHILEFDRVHSGYDERSRYKTFGTKIMVVGQKYPLPHNSVKKITFAKNEHFWWLIIKKAKILKLISVFGQLSILTHQNSLIWYQDWQNRLKSFGFMVENVL